MFPYRVVRGDKQTLSPRPGALAAFMLGIHAFDTKSQIQTSFLRRRAVLRNCVSPTLNPKP